MDEAIQLGMTLLADKVHKQEPQRKWLHFIHFTYIHLTGTNVRLEYQQMLYKTHHYGL